MVSRPKLKYPQPRAARASLNTLPPIFDGDGVPSNARSVTPGSPPPASPDEQTIGPDVGPLPIRLICKSELLKRVPLSFPTIWKMMQQNRFPRARVMGGKSVWIEGEVEDFLAALPLRHYKNDRR
jgi:predicted DNA-binding transcriptional regulator AlpA